MEFGGKVGVVLLNRVQFAQESVEQQIFGIQETGSYAVRSIPAAPTLEAAGDKAFDPVFGTQVMRLTDRTDGSSACRNFYSYAPIFNLNNTRIAVICTVSSVSRIEFFDFNPATFTASNRRLWDQTDIGDDYYWSAVNPDIFYFRVGSNQRLLQQYNIATDTITTVRTFTSGELSGGTITQISRSLDDDVFAFSVRNGGANVGYKVWKRSTNTFLLEQTETDVDEVQIDKSGRYLVAKFGISPGSTVRVWDLQGGPSSTDLEVGAGLDLGFSHSDVGSGVAVATHGSLSQNQFSHRKWALATPSSPVEILEMSAPGSSGSAWYQRNNHFSMLMDGDGWAVITNEGPNTPIFPSVADRPFLYEIYAVATDGSGLVRRYVHHHASVMQYANNAFGNVNRDGTYIAFTSDWGANDGPTDVYLARIAS